MGDVDDKKSMSLWRPWSNTGGESIVLYRYDSPDVAVGVAACMLRIHDAMVRLEISTTVYNITFVVFIYWVFQYESVPLMQINTINISSTYE